MNSILNIVFICSLFLGSAQAAGIFVDSACTSPFGVESAIDTIDEGKNEGGVPPVNSEYELIELLDPSGDEEACQAQEPKLTVIVVKNESKKDQNYTVSVLDKDGKEIESTKFSVKAGKEGTHFMKYSLKADDVKIGVVMSANDLKSVKMSVEPKLARVKQNNQVLTVPAFLYTLSDRNTNICDEQPETCEGSLSMPRYRYYTLDLRRLKANDRFRRGNDSFAPREINLLQLNPRRLSYTLLY